jgi:hypothetical protein
VKFLLLTKSLWREPQRIRHQVATLLATRGHAVGFVEKNRFLGPCGRTASDGLKLLRHGELLHHQLRPFHILSMINAAWELGQIRKLCGDQWQDAVIINFNYDHYFLRTLFKENVIITIINDDFIAGARWYMKKEAKNTLSATVAMSDFVLTVSYPLLEQVKKNARNAAIFFPWARSAYSEPDKAYARTDILFWGSLYENQDFNVIQFLLQSGVRIHFAGPVSSSRVIEKTMGMAGAIYHGVKSMSELRSVVAQCCCAILPYDPESLGGMFKAVTINNRAFELLSQGLPLLYCDLPALINAPNNVILRCRTKEQYLHAYEYVKHQFYECQENIKKFLDGNYEQDRYELLLNYIKICFYQRSSNGLAGMDSDICGQGDL